jgi:hypothetical protein
MEVASQWLRWTGLNHGRALQPEASPAQCSWNSDLQLGRPAMQDLVMLLFTVVFFALAFLYVKACQKLR